MEQLFKIDLKKINTSSQKESLERKKNRELSFKCDVNCMCVLQICCDS